MAPQTIETSSVAAVSPSTTIAQSMPPAATASFDASLVSDSSKFNWCHAQLNTCPQICDGAAAGNTCNSVDFTYTCICKNGTVPDCTAFGNTLPYFICEETYVQCVSNNPNDARAQSACADIEQCGTRNATAEALGHQAQAASPAISSSLTVSDRSETSTRRTSETSRTSRPGSSPVTTSTNAAATSSAPRPPPGLSSGTVAGIAVGSAIAGIIIAALCFWLYRRSRKSRSQKVGNASTPRGEKRYTERQELVGSHASNNTKGPVAQKSELITNANRHELDHTAISATLSAPWSVDGRAELEARNGGHVDK